MKYYLTIILIILGFNSFPLFPTNINFIDVCVKGICFSSRVMDNPITRAKGLMNETFLPANEGMLFVFPMNVTPEFWTKKMHYPIDIMFINDDDIVVYLVKNAPPCKTDECQIFKPTTPVSRVLEINGGLSDKYGIHVGDSVEYYIEDK